MSSSAERHTLYAVIMAGGSGTRFWPLSRRSRPKQLLPFADGRSLLAATVDRLPPLVPSERTLVVTNSAIAAAVRAELPHLPPDNVLIEPVGRDTAACIGWAARKLAQADPTALMLVLPADHVIADAGAMRRALAAAAATAHAHGALVTLALQPTRPETGFGYLELGAAIGGAGSFEVRKVLRFIEKPSHERAREMLAAGNFRWNGGMFAWTVDAIERAIRTHLPELAAGLDAMIEDARTIGEDAAVARHYPRLPKVSIDFGVMEKAPNVCAVPVEFPWSDVGSWLGLEEILPLAPGGVCVGDVVAVETGGSILVSDGPLVAAVGVRDLVVVATRDVVLVLPKEQAQRVKSIVELLEKNGRDELL